MAACLVGEDDSAGDAIMVVTLFDMAWVCLGGHFNYCTLLAR